MTSVEELESVTAVANDIYIVPLNIISIICNKYTNDNKSFFDFIFKNDKMGTLKAFFDMVPISSNYSIYTNHKQSSVEEFQAILSYSIGYHICIVKSSLDLTSDRKLNLTVDQYEQLKYLAICNQSNQNEEPKKAREECCDIF